MMDVTVLRQAVATLEGIAVRNGRSPELQGGEWRRAQIADRRLLFEAIAEIAEAGRRHLATRGDAVLLQRLDGSVTRFRHALALHQANWPVVSINQEDVDYLHSRQAVRTASREIQSLINEMLAQSPTGSPAAKCAIRSPA